MEVCNFEPKILVVEDDPLTRDFVIDLIKSFGYSATSATDGLQAMRLIEDFPSIELVFTDIRMPVVDGIVLADMLKHHRPNIKILYTTGGDGVHKVKAEAGVLHGSFLMKPYRPEQLRDHIRANLG